MKRLSIIAALLICGCADKEVEITDIGPETEPIVIVGGGAVAEDEEPAKPKFELDNYKLTVKITYNSVHLDQAAEVEKWLKEQCTNACTVNVKLDKLPLQAYFVVSSNSYIIAQTNNLWYSDTTGSVNVISNTEAAALIIRGT